ncbi:MAG: HAD family hydrolase [Candidatus Aenigmarchaeota archaeon]|nr:HAD family hydrolase [Candidatus Aenigmarchaeota archaeon]
MMRRLIILDLYGTIVKADKRDGVVRPGLQEFLDYYSDSKKVIFTDGDIETVEADLRLTGLTGKFDRIYDQRHCIAEVAYHMQNEKFRKILTSRGRGDIKNLEQACKDFSIPKSDAVFIGDNFYGRDCKSAEFHGVRFIRVPQYRTNLPDLDERDKTEGYVEYEDPTSPFSFMSLIGKI